MQVVPALLFITAAAGASEWTPDQQARMENPSSPHISASGRFTWAVYTVSTVAGAAGNLTSTKSLQLVPVEATPPGSVTDYDSSWTQPVTDFCADGTCSSPSFAYDAMLFFLKGGKLYYTSFEEIHGWSDPVMVQSLGSRGAIVDYTISTDATRVAMTYADMDTYSTTEGRVIDKEVIVNVILGAAQPLRNVLCIGMIPASSSTNVSAPQCYPEIKGSVGMEGWRISCWPYDSSMSWSADGTTLALTLTSNRLANEWESVHVVVLTEKSTKSNGLQGTAAAGAAGGGAKWDLQAPAWDLSFQPFFHPDGKHLAFTQSVSSTNYTWSQTWKICVADISSPGKVPPVPVCDEVGTYDEMPTIIGWGAEENQILYVEQHGTSVRLYSMAYDVATKKFAPYVPIKFTVGPPWTPPGISDSNGSVRNTAIAGGVIGGGFRSTSRVTITAVHTGEFMIGLTWEDPVTPQQAFVGHFFAKNNTAILTQISSLNAAAAAHVWPTWKVHTWKSDDGTPVEGLLLAAAVKANRSSTGSTAASPPPLIVFTHCGPAMASLATFLGAGSVCARFPLATWAERGYTVLMPNYRGSTGYGRAFRNADFKGWGAGDYEDVMSGFVSLASSGAASLDNAAHVGWSYGGYTSALALTKAKTTHGIHLKAVIGGGSLTDLISQVGTTDISKIYQSSNDGYYWDDAEIAKNFMERSAMYHVQNASAPTLLFHGQHDPRMPISQSFQLHYALQARDITSRFIVFPGSGHIPGDPNQIVRVWTESLAWTDEHIPTK